MSTHLKNGMTTDDTGKPVFWWSNTYLREESHRAEEFGIFIVNKSVTADGSLLSPMGGVKGMYVRVLSPHPIHACARGCLSVLFLVSLYFFLKSFFHLFLMSFLVPDENSMEDPLCNSSFGSMVSLDYVTPDTCNKRGGH